jgi:hypothetical protein
MQSKVMFGKLIINVSMKVKINLYLETNFIFVKILIIKDGWNK